MLIDSAKLTGLFSEKLFHDWVVSRFPNETKAADTASPDEAQAKVFALYEKIYKSDSRAEFKEFMLENYKHAVVDDKPSLVAKLMVPAGPDPNGIFSCYHPNLMRFPMQMMFKSDNLSQQLQEAVAMFSSRFKRNNRTLIVGNIGYVEYLPPGMIKYAARIAGSNWEIPAS